MDHRTCIWFSNPAWFRVKEIDDYHFLYNRRSGDTHVLNFFSYGLLDILSAQKMPLSHMKTAVCEKLSLDEGDVKEALITHTLDELMDIGLVERFADGGVIDMPMGTGDE